VSLYSRHERLILGVTAIAAVLFAWEIVGRTRLVNPIFLSSPTAVFRAGLEMARSGELGVHLRVSGIEFGAGYLLAVLTAVPLGLWAGWHRRADFVLEPFLATFYATPRVALLPVIVLWVGVGLLSKVAVVALGAFFPVCINTIAGVKTVDPAYVRVAQSFRAGKARVFRTIVLPSSLPFILVGLRLGVGRALVGVVVAELFAAAAGIGFLISIAGSTFQTDKVFVGIAVLAAFGVFCNEALSRIERRFERWRPRAHG
jgi:NitT/TauT family transport system permease protein